MIKYILCLAMVACANADVLTEQAKQSSVVVEPDSGNTVIKSDAGQTVIYPAPTTDPECHGVFCSDPVCLLTDGTEWDYSYILTLDQIGGIQSVAKHYHRQDLLCELHNGFVYWRASEGKSYPELDGGAE